MRIFTILLLAFPIILFTACGGNDEPKDEEKIDVKKNPLGALMKMSKNMQENAKKMEKNMEERKDAKAIHYEELMKYLPKSIDGYTQKNEPKGASMDMTGMSYSSAEVKFENNNGDRISVALIDYNAAYSMYSMSTAMWASGFKIDTSEEIGQSISLGDNINGWESYKKKRKNASVMLGIGNRFLLTIEGGNQENCDFLKDIAKSMELDKLASLD
ncbi:MAG: hypothetical protein COA97_08370 [Flavobacteriales bacterium]|nr:MAG: hypothetical protein COA97_08370 [Flavobacteriales bacterium]